MSGSRASDEALAQLEIIRVVDRYAEALDGRDWPLLARVFAPDVRFDWGMWQAEGLDEAVAHIRRFLDDCGPTQHLLGNHRVELAGDEARCACYVRAFHIGSGERAHLHYEMGGEYRDRLRRGPEGWRIHERTARVIFEQGDRRVLGPLRD